MEKTLKSGFVALALIIASGYLSGCIPILLAAGAGAGAVMSQDKKFGDIFKGKVKLHLENASVAPAQVERGQEVTVIVTYKISGTSGVPVKVVEEKTLWHNGTQLKILSNDEFERQDGMWENSLTFNVPYSAEKGEYTVEQKLMLEDEMINSTEAFNVVSN